MKDRIKMIMEAESMTPARFADTLQIGRAVISHILNGRNNPSLDVVTRILTEMPHISAAWLITGSGSMYKRTVNDSVESTPLSPIQVNYQQDLFSQNSINQPEIQDEDEYSTDNELNPSQNTIQNIVNESIIYKNKPERKITKIIIYYDDNTFETFSPEK